MKDPVFEINIQEVHTHTLEWVFEMKLGPWCCAFLFVFVLPTPLSASFCGSQFYLWLKMDCIEWNPEVSSRLPQHLSPMDAARLETHIVSVSRREFFRRGIQHRGKHRFYSFISWYNLACSDAKQVNKPSSSHKPRASASYNIYICIFVI